VSNRGHTARIVALWLIVSTIAEVLLWTVIPTPGPTNSTEGVGEHTTMALLFRLGAPIFIFVCVFMVYAVRTWNDPCGEPDVGTVPLAQNSLRALFIWSITTFSTVIILAGWGTFTLYEVTAASGPNPLVVQVIAQQWRFTYRYPSYGGLETFTLAIPTHRPIKFEITSLDVIHDFWIYDETVKEDAVPGVTTGANLYAKDVGTHWIVCDELCGIWHGYMRNPIYVLSTKDFATWISRQSRQTAPLRGKLPPYGMTYFPDPQAYPSAPQNSAQ